MDQIEMIVRNLQLWPFFLIISFIIGLAAGAYAFLLHFIKNKYIAYSVPLVLIAIWLLWEAAQEYPGPMLPLINMSAIFLIYPMAVIALYPVADYFIKPKNGWWIVLIVTILAMFTSFLVSYGDHVIPEKTDTPPTYTDNLVKGATGILKYMAYGMIFYIIIILIAKIFNFKKKSVENRS